MKYEIPLPARSGDIVPLVAVADAKARFQATAGGTDFHRPAYDGTFKPFADDLLQEAKAGKLKVCNCLGIPGEAEALVAEAEREGDLVVVYRKLSEQEMAQALLRAGNPSGPAMLDLSHLHLSQSDVDLTRTHLGALHTTLRWLNEWGDSRGDEFTVTHEGVEWADERGTHRPTHPGAVSESGRQPRAPEAAAAGPAPVAVTGAKETIGGRLPPVLAPTEIRPANPTKPIPESVLAPPPEANFASGNCAAWTLKKPLRDDGLTGAIYRVLKKAHESKARRPTARDVLEAFREKKPTEIVRVLADGCDFFDRKGNERTADLDGIRKRISWMTATQAPDKAR